MEEAAELLGRADFGLLVAEKRMELGYGHEIIAFAQSCRTLGDAFRGLSNSLRARTKGLSYYLETYGDTAGLVRQVPPDLQGRFPQASLTWASTTIRVFERITDKRWSPDLLTLIGKTFKDVGRVESALGCNVQCNSEIEGVFFDSALLDIEIPTWDNLLNALINEYLEGRYHAEDNDFLGQVRSCIASSLASGRSDISHVSAQLGLKPRTLQLKLQERGEKFSSLLQTARFAHAEALLQQSDLSMTEIAQRLGYRELSAFSRAFKRSHGISPTEWSRAPNSASE